MTLAATLIYGYVFLGSLVWFVTYRCLSTPVSFVDMTCHLGYALAAYIPAAVTPKVSSTFSLSNSPQVLCMIPVAIVQWVVMAVSTVVSGGSLTRHVLHVQSLMPEEKQFRALPLLLVHIAVHLGFGLGLKLYFFHY